MTGVAWILILLQGANVNVPLQYQTKEGCEQAGKIWDEARFVLYPGLRGYPLHVCLPLEKTK